MEKSNAFFYQNVVSGERPKAMINHHVLPAAAASTNRVASAAMLINQNDC